jgi:hypothetical protein
MQSGTYRKRAWRWIVYFNSQRKGIFGKPITLELWQKAVADAVWIIFKRSAPHVIVPRLIS